MAAPSVDGRRARRDRSRDLAVDALLDLLDEGVARPTAQQVAERSGVSLRSIFRIFDDVETLHAEAAARQLERNRAPLRRRPRDGTLADRIAGDRRGPRPPLRGRRPRAAGRTAGRPRLRQALRDQLGPGPGLGAGRDRPRLRRRARRARPTPPRSRALELALSFEAWDQCVSAKVSMRRPGRTPSPAWSTRSSTTQRACGDRPRRRGSRDRADAGLAVPDRGGARRGRGHRRRSPRPTGSLFASIAGIWGGVVPLHRGRPRGDGAGRRHPRSASGSAR